MKYWQVCPMQIDLRWNDVVFEVGALNANDAVSKVIASYEFQEWLDGAEINPVFGACPIKDPDSTVWRVDPERKHLAEAYDIMFDRDKTEEISVALLGAI